MMQTDCGDGVASIKRLHRDLSSDGVEDLTTVSGRNRLKSDLEDSTWYTQIDINHAAGGNLKGLSAEEDHLVKNEVVRVKISKCMSWFDAYNEPICDPDMMEDKVDNLIP
ncbi:hypothetical protein Tco_1298033 [Tanacetum coccineum]